MSKPPITIAVPESDVAWLSRVLPDSILVVGTNSEDISIQVPAEHFDDGLDYGKAITARVTARSRLVTIVPSADVSGWGLAAPPGWQPMENAPRDGTDVLVEFACGSGFALAEARFVDGEWTPRFLHVAGSWSPVRWKPVPDYVAPLAREFPDPCGYALTGDAGLTPLTGWQPIETAPKDGTKFLAYEYDYVWTVWWAEDGSGWDDGEYHPRGRPTPTHWMPLPEPPK